MCDSRLEESVPLNEGESEMSTALLELIEAARSVRSSPEQRESQRRSFAYGNTAFENRRITREMVDRQAEKLAETGNDG